MIRRVVGIYFSPAGATARITCEIADVIARSLADSGIDEVEITYFDMLENIPNSEVKFDDETIAVIGMPCFTGRVPLPCIKFLKKFVGNGTPTIALVAYGNSSYGDSLYELCTFAEEQGFVMMGAGAFITQHHMFGKIGENRPDNADIEAIDYFAKLASDKLRRFAQTSVEHFKRIPAPLEIKGSLPSRTPLRIPIHPSTNSNCICCSKCVSVCPVNAISKLDPGKVNAKRCISCTACIAVCEQDARGFFGPMSLASRVALERLYYKRKEPEWFI